MFIKVAPACKVPEHEKFLQNADSWVTLGSPAIVVLMELLHSKKIMNDM